MQIARFRYFLEVARQHSITGAAHQCFISQTAMSHQMDALEAELGLRLLIRSKTGTGLTQEGEQLVPLAEKLVRDYEQLISEMEALSDRKKRLTVAYTGPMEKEILRKAIQAYRLKHPGTQIGIRQLPMAETGQALQTGDVDIVLTIPGEISIQGVRSVNIMRKSILAAIGDPDPLCRKKQVTIQELKMRPVVLLQEASAHAPRVIADWLLQAGWKRDQIIYADTIESQLLMVCLGQGITFMPEGEYGEGIHLIPMDTKMEHRTDAYYLCDTGEIRELVQILRDAVHM